MDKVRDNAIWELEAGSIAIYTEDKDVMRKIRRSYSDVAKIMAEYYHEDQGNKPYAIQYKAPLSKRKTFEKMLGVKMDKDA